MPRILFVAGPLLVLGIFSLTAEISSCSGSTKDISKVNVFIAGVRDVRDAELEHGRHNGYTRHAVNKLAETIRFPLARSYPLPSIYSADDFEIRYKRFSMTRFYQDDRRL